MLKTLPIWDRRPDRALKLQKVESWSVLAFPEGVAGGLRIEFLRDCAGPERASEQFTLTPVQARELSKALSRLAGQLEGQAVARRP